MSYQGTVKIWREDKGFGFITAEDGTEVFMHLAALADGGMPQPGDTVVFDVEESQVKPGQMQACNVKGGTGQKGLGKGKGKVAAGAWGVQQPAFMKGGYGKAFGGDQGKGKDGKSKSGGKGHLLPRTRISEAPFSGEVVKWSGKYGFIQPSETIEHEKAVKHRGCLFFSEDSIVGGVPFAVGTTVEFHIFEDESGLGAEEVTDGGASQAPAQQPAKGVAKGGGKGKWDAGDAGGKGWDAGGMGNAFQALAAQLFGGKGKWDTGAKGVQQPMFEGKGKWDGGSSWKGSFGKASTGDDGKGKDGKSKNKGKGHTLPRTRISEAPFSGEVVEWKGKYGWIQPSETIEHEKAAKHGGKLFFGQDSIEGGAALAVGTTVQFHIFEDASGIGAEEVVAF